MRYTLCMGISLIPMKRKRTNPRGASGLSRPIPALRRAAVCVLYRRYCVCFLVGYSSFGGGSSSTRAMMINDQTRVSYARARKRATPRPYFGAAGADDNAAKAIPSLSPGRCLLHRLFASRYVMRVYVQSDRARQLLMLLLCQLNSFPFPVPLPAQLSRPHRKIPTRLRSALECPPSRPCFHW